MRLWLPYSFTVALAWYPNMAHSYSTDTDWMLDSKPQAVTVDLSPERQTVELRNGLVSRTWTTKDKSAACTGLELLVNGEQFIRAVRPEAEFRVNGQILNVGGYSGQTEQAYWNPSWLPRLVPESGLDLVSVEKQNLQHRVAWQPRSEHRDIAFNTRSKRVASVQVEGQGIVFTYRGRAQGTDLEAQVRYELYAGQPLFRKQVRLINHGPATVTIDSFKAEILAAVESESVVDSMENWGRPNMTVTTDYTFAGMALGASNKAVRWLPDPSYTTQVNYDLKTPCLLEVAAPVGPGTELRPGESLDTFSVFELMHDTSERERKGLQVRRMYRTLAPWCLENPIMLHLTSSDPGVVKRAIDQASECGFEMVVISFWSGLDMEDVSDSNIEKWRGLVEYAHGKNVELGGYSLLASRSVGLETDVVDPKTGKPGGAVFGNSPCLCSKWGKEYFEKLRTFIDKTGFDLLEHDGSYPGDVCASTTHPGHKGLADSQWRQYAVISDFYKWCRERGIFLNVPDNYFLAGSNKTGMGYRESNWSLPREQQHIHARQNLFDGTWEKTPSMGWMMVPLVEYQGGGQEATIEPLSEHLADYEMHLANNFGYGAQACYRGPRIYDTPTTRDAVIKWVNWFKKHRPILEADVLHLRRADSKDLDYVLHVDPSGEEKGMLVVWNPKDEAVTRKMKIPLHYTGLRNTCQVEAADGKRRTVELDSSATVLVNVKVPARGMTWAVFR